MKSLPLADALKACAAIGYDGVELALMPGYPAEPTRLSAADRKDLRTRLANHRLALQGLMENLPDPATADGHRSNLDRLKAAAELGHSLSPDAAPPIETILGGKPADWEKLRDRLAERMGDWAEAGKAAKTVIAVKPHVGNALHSIDGAVWLLKQVNSPWLRLAFDYSHFLLREAKLADAVAALVPLSAFIHVKDAKGTAAKFEFLLPGEQGIDYADYVKRLIAAGYGGPVVVEVSGQISNKPGYDPVAAAKRSYTNLAAAFQREAD
jgi:inosose dehydratase